MEKKHYYAVRGIKSFSGYVIHAVEGRGEDGCPKRDVIYVYDRNEVLIAYEDSSPCECCIRPATHNPFYEECKEGY